MTTNPAAPNGAALWMRREASENPRSVVARIRPDSLEPIARRLAEELPNASAQQRSDWLIAFEQRYPDHFKPFPSDLKGLSAAQLLAVANGERAPAPIRRRIK